MHGFLKEAVQRDQKYKTLALEDEDLKRLGRVWLSWAVKRSINEKARKGFSILELLVVISIIGILIGSSRWFLG